MNSKFLCSAASLLLACAIHAEEKSAKPFPGFVNEWIREKNPELASWDIGGNDRLRVESRQGFGIAGIAGSVDFLDHGKTVSNDYLLNRLRVHIGYTDKWWNVYVEPQSSLAANDRRVAYANVPAVPGTVKRTGSGPEADAIDLHQAYFTIGNHKEFPVSLKLGRQELSYGEERLVGGFGWNNIGRSFDTAKVRWQNAWFGADFFSGFPVIPQDGKFDVPNTHDVFSGIYGTSTKIPKTILDFYFLARNSSRQAINTEPSPQFPQPTARDIYTVGGRLKSKPGELGHWDYLLDGAYQFGNFAATGKASRKQQDAYMFVAQAGYTFSDLWATPRLAVEYDYGSGDSNAADGKHGTFENLFPTNHKFYGYMDFFSLQNIQDVRGIFQLKPTSRLNISLEGHAFWLANTHDALYTAGGGARLLGGYGVHPGYDSFVGNEVDLIAGYALTKYAALEGGYGHFFRGKYIDQSLAGHGGARDADWVYLQATLTF